MNLYALVFECGKPEEIIVLNRNFSKEQLKEELSKMEHIPKKYVDYILESGRYLEPNETLAITASSNGTVTTQKYGTTNYFYEKYKIVIKSDAEFEVISYFAKKAK